MARPQLKISVPKPCSENWNAMTPEAKGRFCASCDTTVVDFSQFTDPQLLEYFANPSGKTCGRFSASQLNRPVYAETLPKQNFFPRALAAAALFLGISSQAQAQNTYDHPIPTGQVVEKKAAGEETPAKTVGKMPEKVSGDSLVIAGRVIDRETKEPIYFGNVFIKDTNIGTQTDLEGKFQLIVPNNLQFDEFILMAPTIGYKTSETVVSREKIIEPIEIFLSQHITGLSEMVVIEPERITPGYYLRSFWWKTKSLFRKND